MTQRCKIKPPENVDEDRWHVAVHEAGHAVGSILRVFANDTRTSVVTRIRIVREGDRFNGRSCSGQVNDPTDNDQINPIEWLIRHLVEVVSGEVADRIVFGDEFYDDPLNSSNLSGLKGDGDAAKLYLYGMPVGQTVDSDSLRWHVVAFAYVIAERVLLNRIKELENLARALYDQEELSDDDLRELLNHSATDQPSGVFRWPIGEFPVFIDNRLPDDWPPRRPWLTTD